MKKIIALLIVLTIVLTFLAGCKKKYYDELPEGMSGKEAARLLLANERLNAESLKNSGHIFDDGAETLMELAEKVELSLAGRVTVTDPEVGSEVLAGTSYKSQDGSVVEVDGTTFRWSGFAEYSNSYDYFLNLTHGISSTATQGADLIDHVKKHVRVVDKWVEFGNEEYYLHVEKNREVLYSRGYDTVRMCSRTKTADGANLYEIYISNPEGGSSRMMYSEGKLCEYSYILRDFNHNFYAVNNKGFWEVVDVGAHDTHFNVSCMVIKNDICYDAFYDPVSRDVGTLKVISADRNTDLLWYVDYEGQANVSVMLQGFSGYDYIELKTTEDKILPLETHDYSADVFYYDNGRQSEKIYIAMNTDKLEIALKNGDRLKHGDSFVDGKVTVDKIGVSHFTKEPEPGSHEYSGGYVPEIELRIDGDSFEEHMTNLERFFEEVGLVCNRDMDYVKAGILRAHSELLQFTKYHTWNESPIYTVEDLERGWENNLAKHAAYKAEYEKIKNAERINGNDTENMELNMLFAPITAESSVSVTNDGFKVSVKGLALTVDDTLLFVVGEKYTLSFALLMDGAGAYGVNHLASEVVGEVEFTGGDSFTVTADASLEIPAIDSGVYKLAAFITTADGIRSSDFKPIVFTALTPAEKTVANASISLSAGEGGTAKVTQNVATDIEVTLDGGKEYTYATLFEELSEKIYDYAFVGEGAVLEVKGADGSFSAVQAAEGELAAGTYRLKYEIRNGDVRTDGYVYAAIG